MILVSIKGKEYTVEPFPAEYSEGNSVTVYNGKCEDFVRSLPDESVQLVVTSPPYNIGKAYEEVMPLEDYLSWQDEVIGLCASKLTPNGSLCWQVGTTIDPKSLEKLPLDALLFNSFRRHGLHYRNRIIWHFGHGANDSKRFSGRYETILWFARSEEPTFNLDDVRVPQKYPGKKAFRGERVGQYTSNPLGKNPSDFWSIERATDVWSIPNVKSNHTERIGNHQCQFPVALAQRLILALSSKGDLVLDPFMGVGTTQVAAVLNDRKTAGCEILKEYSDAATWRIRQAMQGALPVREDKPVYEPIKENSLTRNPFVSSSQS